ncbi:MAG: TonB-dependent receptor [Nibricoccus sp.]
MQNTPMATIRRNSKRAFLALSSVIAVSLSAQTAVDSKPEQIAGDDVVKLSPFQVSTEKDIGYKASNSIAGSRTNTPIKDIALNIQVFTKDLAQDLIIADHTQLERYNAALVNGNADVQSDNVIQQAYGAFLFRGFVQNWGMRDGVREYDPVDAQGIARVEIVKGPAAALYGLSYAGGIMNTITKRVDMGKEFVSLTATLTDQGTQRGTVDANFFGKVGGAKAGVRYNGAAAKTEDKREHSQGRTRFNQVNFELQPLDGTSIQLLVENAQRQKPNGLGYYTIAPSSTGQFGTKYTNLVTGIGASVPLQVLHPEIPWTWNWATASNPRALETSMYRLTVNQAIGENLNITAYVQNNQRDQPDSQGWDDGGNSQNGAGWDTGGTYLKSGWIANASGQEVIRRVYHYRNWKDQDHAQGVTAVYKLETGPVKNTITAGAAHWDERFTSHKYLTVDAPNYQFWDLPVLAGIPIGTAPEPSDYALVSPGGNREHNQNTYYFAAWMVSALDNRLKLNAAINHTKIKNLIWPNASSNDNYSGKVDISKDSPMFGAMFDITKEISVFAVHSTSLFPTTDKNDELTVQMPPEIGKSNEFGVKVELLNGKISGTVSYYKINKNGGGVRDNNAENANKLIWDTLTNAQRLARGWSLNRNDITSGDGINGSRGNIVPAELESKGFEADVVFQPIKSLQLVLSYAHNTEESTKGTTKGQSNGGHVKDQLAGLVKYTFDSGAVKGLFVGSGFQASGKSIADYQTDNAGATVARYNPSTFNLEVFSGYRFKAFGVDQRVQLNIKNLTKQDDFIGWKSVASNQVATERYRVPTYTGFSLTWGLDF